MIILQGKAKDVKNHEWFSDTNWDDILSRNTIVK